MILLSKKQETGHVVLPLDRSYLDRFVGRTHTYNA